MAGNGREGRDGGDAVAAGRASRIGAAEGDHRWFRDVGVVTERTLDERNAAGRQRNGGADRAIF